MEEGGGSGRPALRVEGYIGIVVVVIFMYLIVRS